MATVRINGEDYEAPDERFRSLLTFLLVDLGFDDMHYNCRQGQCGTCMLKVDGRWMKSCILPMESVVGKEVLTQGELRRQQAAARAAREAEAATNGSDGVSQAPADPAAIDRRT